jgi:uncharacterized protein
MNQHFTYVFLAGYGNSIGDHWQAKWFRQLPNSVWVEQKSWDYPVCEEWVIELDKSLIKINQPVVIIAHSLGCLTFIEWAGQNRETCAEKITGAFLVAVPDADATNFPKDIKGYQFSSFEKLPVKSLMIASSNDPYASVDRTEFIAKQLGSELIWIGEKGHINLSAGFGDWLQGEKFLREFLE